MRVWETRSVCQTKYSERWMYEKTEQCSSSWSSWCRTWSRLIAAQCTSTATTTIYLLFRTVMNALNVLSETDWFQSVSATSVLCTSVNVVLKSAKLGLRWLGSHNSGVKQGVQLKRWRWSRKVNGVRDLTFQLVLARLLDVEDPELSRALKGWFGKCRLS